jgi:hypothetical protein
VKTVTCTILTTGAMLMVSALATAQKPERFRSGDFITVTASPGAAARSPLAVIERLMSFDANKDHRITRDELPERMQALIARSDKNADGVLDAEEVRAAVNAASSDRTRVAVRFQPSDGLPGVINDLKLSPAKREQALAILGADKLTPNVNAPATSDLYKAMRLLLHDEEYENFAAAVARLSKTVQARIGTREGIVRRLPPAPTVR